MKLTEEGFFASRVISVRKLEKALSKGNLDGLRRLAQFVHSTSVYPQTVYNACEQERYDYYEEEMNGPD